MKCSVFATTTVRIFSFGTKKWRKEGEKGLDKPSSWLGSFFYCSPSLPLRFHLYSFPHYPQLCSSRLSHSLSSKAMRQERFFWGSELAAFLRWMKERRRVWMSKRKLFCQEIFRDYMKSSLFFSSKEIFQFFKVN